MMFRKTNNASKVIRMTGNQDNILGVCFSESDDNTIEEIEWNVKEGAKIQTSGDQVFKQVLSGLEWVNESLGSNYKLSKIYFVPSDNASNSVYTVLICKLIRHFHSGNKFQEMPGLH